MGKIKLLPTAEYIHSPRVPCYMCYMCYISQGKPLNGSIASANNATLATVAANYGLKTVVDQHSLDIAARITPLEVDTKVANALLGAVRAREQRRARKTSALLIIGKTLQRCLKLTFQTFRRCHLTHYNSTRGKKPLNGHRPCRPRVPAGLVGMNSCRFPIRLTWTFWKFFSPYSAEHHGSLQQGRPVGLRRAGGRGGH